MKHIIAVIACIIVVVFIDDAIEYIYPRAPVAIENTTVGTVMPPGPERDRYMKLYKYHGYPWFVTPDGYFYRKNKHGKMEKCKFYVDIPKKGK